MEEQITINDQAVHLVKVSKECTSIAGKLTLVMRWQ
jgi:hypothetical protein